MGSNSFLARVHILFPANVAVSDFLVCAVLRKRPYSTLA